jgi:hypothetical protein
MSRWRGRRPTSDRRRGRPGSGQALSARRWKARWASRPWAGTQPAVDTRLDRRRYRRRKPQLFPTLHRRRRDCRHGHRAGHPGHRGPPSTQSLKPETRPKPSFSPNPSPTSPKLSTRCSSVGSREQGSHPARPAARALSARTSRSSKRTRIRRLDVASARCSGRRPICIPGHGMPGDLSIGATHEGGIPVDENRICWR